VRRGIERVALAAAVPTGGLLDAAAALVQSIAGQAHDVERVHHRDRVGQFFAGGGLETGEPVHRNHLDAVAPGRVSFAEPGLEHLLRSAFDHIQQPRRTGAVRDWRQVDDYGDVLIAAAGVAPAVLVDADHAHAVEPVWVLDQHTPALGQHRVVRGVPRHAEALGDPSDGQVLTHDAF
jgi:hypothetical protein